MIQRLLKTKRGGCGGVGEDPRGDGGALAFLLWASLDGVDLGGLTRPSCSHRPGYAKRPSQSVEGTK